MSARAVNDETGAVEASRSHSAAAVGAVPPKAPDRQTIPAKAGDPPRPDAGRTTGRASAAHVSSLAAHAAQLAPAGEPGGGSFTGRGHRREFTAEDDAIICAAANGVIKHREAVARLRCGFETFYRRARTLGLPVRQYRQDHRVAFLSALPTEWIPIAHGNSGKWREYEGTPISLEAARRAVADGVATMAQKRVDGEFDILFRARGKIAL